MKKFSYSICFFIFMPTVVFSQIVTVIGTITDSKSREKLVGATVQMGNKGAISDENGVYTLELNKAETYTAFVTYIGYLNLEKKVVYTEGGKMTVDFALSEGNNLLSTTTVTAGKFDKPLGEVTVSLDILQTKLIENTNTRRVDDVLQKVPGVNIIDGQANIRGGSGWSYGAGSRVLLLIDDIPALQADAGFPNWRDVAVENIEQIEVVKGAASALYGSSAMNGIINIRTGFAKSTPETKVSTFYTAYLPPKDPIKHWWSKARGGGQPYEAGASITHKEKYGKLDFVGTLFYYNQSSFLKHNYEKYGRFSTSLRYRVTDKLSVGINANFNKGNNNNFFYFGNHLDSAYIGKNGTYSSSDKFRFTIDPYLTYFDDKGNRHKILTRYYSVKNQLSNNQSNSSQLYYAEYQYQRKFENNLVVTAGIVGTGTNIKAQLYGGDNFTSQNYAAYAQGDKKWGKWNVSLGVRYEKNTIFGPDSVTFTTFYREAVPNGGRVKEAKPVMRLGVNYQVANFTYLRASWGQGYRFPTVAEMFINTAAGGLRIFPNPQLTSETGWSGEIGVKQGFKIRGFQGYIDVSHFSLEYQNMMEFLLNSTFFPKTGEFGFQSQNIGDTRIKGYELSVAGQGKIGKLTPSVLLGYTYINSTYKDFDAKTKSTSSVDYNVLKYRFKHNVKCDIEIDHPYFSVGLAVLYNSNMEAVDRILVDVLKGVKEYRATHDKGFATVDLRTAYKPTNKLKISLIAANIFNTDYSYRPGLLEAPRNIQARLDIKF